jgi:Protein of unknown function (DUF3606)
MAFSSLDCVALPENFSVHGAWRRPKRLVRLELVQGTDIAVRQSMEIDVNRNDDIEFWAQRFGITRAQLVAAVAAAGPKVTDVAARIRRERVRRREGTQRELTRRRAFHAYD